jgi:predicted neutral ceramidase superfamily lipid hydrolase
MMGRALFFIYFVGFFTPIAICILMRASGKKVPVAKIITIYGYSYFIYLIAACVVIIQNDIVQWICLIYAGVSSVTHLIICIRA